MKESSFHLQIKQQQKKRVRFLPKQQSVCQLVNQNKLQNNSIT